MRRLLIIIALLCRFKLKLSAEMGRSKHKSGQQNSGQQNCHSQNLKYGTTRSKACSPSPESEEELEERLTVSTYGEKMMKMFFHFAY